MIRKSAAIFEGRTFTPREVPVQVPGRTLSGVVDARNNQTIAGDNG